MLWYTHGGANLTASIEKVKKTVLCFDIEIILRDVAWFRLQPGLKCTVTPGRSVTCRSTRFSAVRPCFAKLCINTKRILNEFVPNRDHVDSQPS